ncbi:MAG: hypothetical protein LUC37_06485, partial [Prevotella sp.]|nr:hypothetical protein [Prevotella sp.]
RQMILQFGKIKIENQKLCEKVDSQASEIKLLKQKLEQALREKESLKMAKMMEISDQDIEAAKRRVAGLIRDVNKCITLLSEK